MKRKSIFSLKISLLLLWSLAMALPSCLAQEKTDANIFGHVIDKKTNEHLPYVNIAIYKDTASTLKGKLLCGTSTDETGHYIFHNAPVGDLVISATMVGYKPKIQKIKLTKGTSNEVNIELEQSSLLLNELVVSANRYGVDRKEASTVVNVIPPQLFENTNSCNLAEGLNYQAGLRVENNCQNCGFNSVRINGMDGRYSQILIDSRPIFSALAGVYGLEQIPASMIDRVEVVRGGGSALFGANAIGGVINVITREPLKNSLEISHTLNNLEGKAWDNVTSMNAAMVSQDRKAGAYVFGTARNRQAFDHDGDGFTELGRLRNASLGMRGYYRFSPHSKLSIEYHNTYEYRRGGDSTSLPPHQSAIAEQAEHHINGGSINYDLTSKDFRSHLSAYTSAQHIARNSYYGAGYDIKAYGNSIDFSTVSGAQYSYSFPRLLFLPAELMGGVEFSFNKLRDTQPAYKRAIVQDVKITSAFLQNEWKTPHVGLLLGVRADKHSMMDKVILSPRANLRLTFLKDFTNRTSYSSGFRAPQAFDEDLHIMAVGGEVSIISLSPTLRPEYSNSFSESIGWSHQAKNCVVDALLEGFYTSLKDVFVLRKIGTDADGNSLLERGNGSGAYVAGINVEAGAAWNNSLGIRAGFTLQRSRYKEPETWSDDASIKPQTKMFRTPDSYGFISADYTFLSSLKVALSGVYTGPMLVQHFAGYIEKDREETTPRFLDLNIKASYDFNMAQSATLQVFAGIQNIFNSYQRDFDKGPNRDAGYIYGPNLPRTMFVGAKLAL